MLMVLVSSMASVVVRPPSIVIRSVIWITSVIAVIAARVIAVPVSRVSVVAVTICGIAEANADSSDPDRNPSVSLFCWDQGQYDCYQWK